MLPQASHQASNAMNSLTDANAGMGMGAQLGLWNGKAMVCCAASQELRVAGLLPTHWGFHDCRAHAIQLSCHLGSCE